MKEAKELAADTSGSGVMNDTFPFEIMPIPIENALLVTPGCIEVVKLWFKETGDVEIRVRLNPEKACLIKGMDNEA